MGGGKTRREVHLEKTREESVVEEDKEGVEKVRGRRLRRYLPLHASH